ncbi:MAG: O-antigen ligase family protein [Candidatus Eisenbacteria bacterium]|nr:O-antigen ligase family protein [Candidatus Eisenbacteria bacterium]
MNRSGPLSLVLIALVVGAVGALAVVNLPTQVGWALAIALLPIAAVLLAVLKRPFLGVLLIYFLEYFRPQDMIAPLQPLRLPFLTTIAMFGVFIILVIRDPNRRLIWSRQSTTLVGLLAFMGLSVITSINNYWAFQYFRGMALTVILYMLTVNLVDRRTRVRALIGLLVAAHIFLCGKGIVQFLVGNRWGTTGSVGGNFLGDENDFAMALIVIFPFVFFHIEESRRAGKKLFWALLAGVLLVTVMLTMSRGGFVGMSATLFFCWLRSRRKLLGAFVMILLISAVAAIAPSRYFEEIASIRNTDEGTAHKRREYWLAGMRMFAEKPLIGVGPGNSPLYMPRYLDLPNPDTQWGRAMHGTVPLLVAEMGAAGIAIYTILALQCLGDLRKTLRYGRRGKGEGARFARYFGTATLGSAIGFLVTSSFLSALYYPHIYLITSFCVIGLRLSSRAEEEEEER